MAQGAGGAGSLQCDVHSLHAKGYEVMVTALQGARPTGTLHHDPRSLALAVMRFYRRHKGGRPVLETV